MTIKFQSIFSDSGLFYWLSTVWARSVTSLDPLLETCLVVNVSFVASQLDDLFILKEPVHAYRTVETLSKKQLSKRYPLEPSAVTSSSYVVPI